MMKKIIIFLILAIAFGTSAKAQEPAQFFQLPLIPDSLNTLQKRSDYLVTHYWDFCDLKKAFSSRDKMAAAFDTYLTLMPHASAEVVFAAIKNFMGKLAKQPDDMVFIGRVAEEKLYSPEAELRSDDLFIAFANEIIANKRVDKAVRQKYEKLTGALSSSAIGQKAPEFDYVDNMGTRQRFSVDSTKVATILFLQSPDCSSCNMARLRLDADVHTTRLLEAGRACVVSITTTDEVSSIKPVTATGWMSGASTSVDKLYDMVTVPIFYLIDSEGKIVLKTGDENVVIEIMSRLRAPRRKASTPVENITNSEPETQS